MMPSKKSKPRQKLNFEAIGTHWQIEFDGPNLEAPILNRIEIFDQAYSRFRKDSLVTKMSTTQGVYKLPPDAWPMLTLYKDLYDKTEGLVTPLIGNLMEQTGYDSNYSLIPQTPQIPPAWEDAIELDPVNLKIKKPVLLDFGASGKGYLIDLVGELLQKNNVDSFSIDAGGDILLSNWPSRIGLENPHNNKQVIGVYELENGSICGSSGNRRKWGEFHHIMNPETLRPTTEILATWVISKTAMLADALATCLFFVGPEKLTDYKFDYLILYPNFSIETNRRLSQ